MRIIASSPLTSSSDLVGYSPPNEETKKERMKETVTMGCGGSVSPFELSGNRIAKFLTQRFAWKNSISPCNKKPARWPSWIYVSKNTIVLGTKTVATRPKLLACASILQIPWIRATYEYMDVLNTYVCVQIHIYVCAYICMYTYIRVYMYTCIPVHKHACFYMYIRIYIRKCTYI